jgi:hypothetical protein
MFSRGLTSRGIGRRVPLSRALPVFLLAGTWGCAAAPEVKILTSANAFAYYEARYSEACVASVGPTTCDKRHAVLIAWRARLDEAEAALKRGGKLPLQLAELRKQQKEARKWARH